MRQQSGFGQIGSDACDAVVISRGEIAIGFEVCLCRMWLGREHFTTGCFAGNGREVERESVFHRQAATRSIHHVNFFQFLLGSRCGPAYAATERRRETTSSHKTPYYHLEVERHVKQSSVRYFRSDGTETETERER